MLALIIAVFVFGWLCGRGSMRKSLRRANDRISGKRW